jgi:hypothetical protein
LIDFKVKIMQLDSHESKNFSEDGVCDRYHPLFFINKT